MRIELRNIVGPALLLAGSILTVTEAKEHIPAAITLPLTSEGVIFYFDEKTPSLVSHEENHRRQIQKMGQWGFLKYYFSDWCRAETDAGAYTSHTNCDIQRKAKKFTDRLQGRQEQKVIYSTRR